MCERPSGSSHVEDGGGAAQEQEHLKDLDLNLVEEADQGRESRQFVANTLSTFRNNPGFKGKI
jgi:hypothetical protein